MMRLPIFTILFPPLALVVFNTPDMIAGRFNLMDFNTLQMAYIIAVIPAWLMAAVDWWQKNLWVTALAGGALGYVGAFCVGFPFSEPFSVLMVGLVGAVPAGLCSWLSNINQGKQGA